MSDYYVYYASGSDCEVCLSRDETIYESQPELSHENCECTIEQLSLSELYDLGICEEASESDLESWRSAIEGRQRRIAEKNDRISDYRTELQDLHDEYFEKQMLKLELWGEVFDEMFEDGGSEARADEVWDELEELAGELDDMVEDMEKLEEKIEHEQGDIEELEDEIDYYLDKIEEACDEDGDSPPPGL